MDPADEVTQILGELREGDEASFSRLLSLLYDEMHRLASGQLRRERADHTLQPTALLNEAYMRLVDQRNQNWKNRSHFLAVASTAMRRVLLHHAQKRRADKRGGGAQKVTLFEAASVFEERADDLLALDEALDRLAEFDPVNARLVELRFFGGLPMEEIAKVLEIPLRSAERGWRVTRAWLKNEIEKDSRDEEDG